MSLEMNYAASQDMYTASHRCLIKYPHYGDYHLSLGKVPQYLIDWRLFVYNIVIYNEVAFKIIL